MRRYLVKFAATAAAVVALMVPPALACTGITLIATDGTLVYGRTMEWGSFDLGSRLVVVPRGHDYVSQMADGSAGMSWTGVYGVVGLDGLDKDVILDGMNEKGLTAGIFYHPGFAEYRDFDPARATRTLNALDVAQYLLTTAATLAEARAAMADVDVVGVVEPAIGLAPPIHLMLTDPSGARMVIEFVGKEVQIYDAPLGVITNSPTYDWHMTNMRNYVNLSAVAWPDRKIEDLDFKPLGGGSGLIGLPGDFTPPSRFVRAVAFTQTARPTPDGTETMYELFRILDNFNVPLGASEGSGPDKTEGMRSSTIWTTAYDTRDLVLQYHTMHDRRVRQVDMKAIDFDTLTEYLRMPLDIEKTQDILDVTPEI